MNTTITYWPKWSALRLSFFKKAIKSPLALAVIFSFLLASAATATNSATRTLPSTYTPNQEISVTLTVTTEMIGWALQEIVPEGWIVTDSGGIGTVQSNGREIRYFSLEQVTNKTITYKAKAPASGSEAGTFTGILTVDGDQFNTDGSTSIAPADGTPDPEPQGNVAVRQLPAAYIRGKELEVTILITTTQSGWTLQEVVPVGWTVTDSGEGELQNNGREIRFLSMTKASNQAFTYKAKPFAHARTARVFSGIISVDGKGYNVDGDIFIAPDDGPPEPDPSGNSAVRNLPASYTADEELEVTILITTTQGGWTFQEIVPEGWTVTDNGEGELQSNGREIRFFSITKASKKVFTYKARSAAGATTPASFTGNINVNGIEYNVAGDTSLALAGGLDESNIGGSTSIAPAGDVPDPSGNSTKRHLPPSYTAGTPFNVTLIVTTTSGGWAMRETVPEGWSITDGGEGTVQDNGREIRFFSMEQANKKSLTYTVKPPANATKPASFSGTLTIDVDQVNTTGDQSSILP